MEAFLAQVVPQILDQQAESGIRRIPLSHKCDFEEKSAKERRLWTKKKKNTTLS